MHSAIDMNIPELNSRVSVLVVGAGPVGLVAAIALRERGVPVRIVDEHACDDKRTYPVVMHARTLRILDSLGVVGPLEWRGHVVTELVIYSERKRRAVLALPAAGRVAPGVMTLPQDVLRQSLMHRLSELGVEVEWKTRLLALEQTPLYVRSSLMRRERVEGAAPELRPEWLDVESASVESDYVIGADGVASSVRRQLAIHWIPQGPRRIFAFFDAPDSRAGSEAHLVLHEGQGNTVYPLQSDISRFSFELSIGTPQAPGLTQLNQLLLSRMPWYAAEPRRLEWSGTTEFSPGLADRFGEGRVWLAGDAAHSTGPLGAQSLNVGVHEARDLARRIAEHLERRATGLDPTYAQQRRLEWQVLFGLAPSEPLAGSAHGWVQRNLPLILQALPAGGDELDDLLEQLHVRAA